MRLVVEAMAEPEPVQHLDPELAHVRRRARPVELQGKLDVLVGAQRVEQIVHLKDEADAAPDPHQLARRERCQVLPQHLDPALLHRAQRADQGQHRGFARARGAGHHHQLSGRDVDMVVEQHLKPRVALAVEEIDGVGAHHRCGPIELRPIVDLLRYGHQNTSAGSAAITRRTASPAESRHIPRVRPKLNNVSCSVICIGNSARLPIAQYRKTVSSQAGT